MPDWPLSYGTWFPPMVGGVFYEHGHRMIASVVGLFMLILAIWLGVKDDRKWVRVTGYWGLAAVIAQGLLGGITVLFYLPTPVSVMHGVLAQTFFLITIFLAYSQSKERQLRTYSKVGSDEGLQTAVGIGIVVIYIQLILGAIMRHTGSGLAIYDFPTMAGEWWPAFDQMTLNKINGWRFTEGHDPVKMTNVMYHLLHRLGAVVVVLAVAYINLIGLKCTLPNRSKVVQTIGVIDALILVQITLGIMTVLTQKSPVITSFHVVVGAATLGFTFLLYLRTAPVRGTEK